MADKNKDQYPQSLGIADSTNHPNTVSPREEFILAHPEQAGEGVAFKKGFRDLDPNARRVEQLRGIGGGLAAATNGEIKFAEDAPAKKSNGRSTRAPSGKTWGDSEADTGPPVYFDEPVILDEDQRALNAQEAARIKAMIAQGRAERG